jgi:hypothetical protein
LFFSLFSHNAITSKVVLQFVFGIAKSLHASMNLEEFEISIFGRCFLSLRSVGSTRPKTLSLLYCLHCTALHCTALHCTALHCTALHCTALHCTSLHCTALYCTVLYCLYNRLQQYYVDLFFTVNNIEQYYSSWMGCNNAEQYC